MIFKNVGLAVFSIVGNTAKQFKKKRITNFAANNFRYST